MSIYEVIVFFVLAGAGGFAYYLYRQDTRPGSPGGEVPERPPGRPMFERTPPSEPTDKK
jgi:hypothetical protein